MPETATCIPTSRSIRTTTRCCSRPTARWRASCNWHKDLGGVISGEHGIGITKFEFLEPDEIERVRRVQAAGRPGRTIQQGQAARAEATWSSAYTPSFNLMELESLILEKERTRRDLRFDQGLPALRQVQAGVRHPCAARQPAVFAAQQDTRHLAADRGLPVRGADTARHFDPAFRRIRRCRRPLHGMPQVPESLPGGHRFRRCIGRDAQFPAQAGQEKIQPGHRGGDAVPQRHRPDHHQAGAHR